MDTWFTMLIGIPGSGKSTWLAKQNNYVICPDSIRQYLSGDISDQEQNATVWKLAQYTTNWALANNISVILDATNTNTMWRRVFLNHLPQANFKRKAIIFQINPDVAVERIKFRLAGSKVPADVVYRMHGDLLYTMKTIKEECWDLIETIYVEEL